MRLLPVAVATVFIALAYGTSVAADTTFFLGYEGAPHTEVNNNGQFVVSPTLEGPSGYSVTGRSLNVEHGIITGLECPILLLPGTLDQPTGNDGQSIGAFQWTELEPGATRTSGFTLGAGQFTVAESLEPGVYTVRIVCEVVDEDEPTGPMNFRFDGYTAFTLADPSVTTTTAPSPSTTTTAPSPSTTTTAPSPSDPSPSVPTSTVPDPPSTANALPGTGGSTDLVWVAAGLAMAGLAGLIVSRRTHPSA